MTNGLSVNDITPLGERPADVWRGRTGVLGAGVFTIAGSALAGSPTTSGDVFVYDATTDSWVIVNDSTFGSVTWFNVKTYGATGDGTTDDTTAIAAAITACEATKGIVYFPPGTYLISSTLSTAVTGVSFLGDGYNASLILAAPAMAASTMLSLTGGETFVRGLTFTSASIKSGGAGVSIGAYEITVEGCRFDNQYDSIRVTSGTPRYAIRVLECMSFNNSRHGIWIDGSGNDFFLTNLYFWNSATPTGYGLYASGGDAINASHCDFINWVDGVRIAPTTGQTSRWHFFDNVQGDGCSEDGIHLGGDAGDVFGVEMVNCWGGTNGRHGLFAGGGAGGLSGITDKGGRYFSNVQRGVLVTTPAINVKLAGSTMVSNSRSSAGTYPGITIDVGVLNISIIGCRAFNGMGLSSTQSYGLAFTSGATDYLVLDGNDFSGNLTGTIQNLAGVTGTHQFIGGSASMTGASASTYLDGTGAYSTPSGSGGTVTSVGLTVPAEFSVSGSPVTGSGTLAITKAVESAGTFWAGPTSGAAAAPTFRAIATSDLPGGVASDHEHVNNVTFNGDGATTVFYLPAAPFDAYSIGVYVGTGRNSDWTLSGAMLDVLTFGSAPVSGTNNVSVDIVAAVG